MKRSKRKYWFWAELRTITMPMAKCRNAACFGEVWDNLYLIHASSEKEAYKKANKMGRLLDGGPEVALRYNGKPAYCRFLGLTGMGYASDGVEDGAEILFSQSRKTLGHARRGVKAERALLAPIKAELEIVRSVGAIPIRQLPQAPPPPGVAKKLSKRVPSSSR